MYPFAISILTLAPSLDVPLEIKDYQNDRNKYDITEFQKPFFEFSSDDAKLSRFISRLNTIKNLENNWDGMNAAKVEEIVVENTMYLLTNILDYELNRISEDSVIPTPYGTILVELITETTDFVIEISEDEISYYVEKEEEDLFIEGIFQTEAKRLDEFSKLNQAFQHLS